MSEEKRIYTVKDVALMFEKSVGTIYRWIEKGYLSPSGKLPNGQMVFTNKQVKEMKSQYFGE